MSITTTTNTTTITTTFTRHRALPQGPHPRHMKDPPLPAPKALLFY